jgi:DNA-binding CsgD family transcriptional regulator
MNRRPIFRALLASEVDGYIPLSAPPDTLIGTLQQIIAAEREEQILRNLVKGLPNKIIARKLDIAEATVKVHIKSVLRKIRMANRTQAAIWALENGYATDNPHPELPPLEASLQPLEAPR